jgi:hypothetical protein
MERSAGPARFPDFFLVGAPKCGTTALYRWLRAHPDVYMPELKEPHFFGSDLEWRNRAPFGEEDYLALFRDVRDEHRVGEASTFYLYSRRAAAEIHARQPEARILVMLREPVETMYALHAERVFGGNEDIADFREALAAEPERKAGGRIPPLVRLVQGLFYRDVVAFAEQVERYFDTFGRARVHVILFEDFTRDPEGSYAEVCRFLDVDASFRPEFAPANPAKTPRSEWVRDLLVDRDVPGKALVRRVLPLQARYRIVRALVRANTRERDRAPLDPALRRALRAELRPGVERLAALLERDLSAWLAPD